MIKKINYPSASQMPHSWRYEIVFQGWEKGDETRDTRGLPETDEVIGKIFFLSTGRKEKTLSDRQTARESRWQLVGMNRQILFLSISHILWKLLFQWMKVNFCWDRENVPFWASVPQSQNVDFFFFGTFFLKTSHCTACHVALLFKVTTITSLQKTVLSQLNFWQNL